MSNLRTFIATLFLCITGFVFACWYPTYEPQYYLTYNLTDESESQTHTADMIQMWRNLMPETTDNEIKSLIYSDGYSIANIRALKLTPSLNAALRKDSELHDYVVLMRQVADECDKTVDPWYFYYDNDPKLHKLDSLAQVAKDRINGRYGDRYAVQAARALKALKRYDDIIAISQNHSFQDDDLHTLFDENLASAFYYTGNYDKAIDIYRKSGDEISLRWTLEKLGEESNPLALARQLSMAKGNEVAIANLLQEHIRNLEVRSDKNNYWGNYKLSPIEVGNLLSTAKDAASNVLECYKPIWQYTEGFAYLINLVDYEKADSVFAQIDLAKASTHLKNQVRTLRFIAQSYIRPYGDDYKRWFAREASWLCERGKVMLNAKRAERAASVNSDGFDLSYRPEEWYQSFCENVLFFRNTHQSYCYPLDMLHRAADCIVVPKMLVAADTVIALQLLDLVDHAGLSDEEIKMVDSHGSASACFALECGADIVKEAQSSLNTNTPWATLMRNNGSIASFPDRWNDLIGTLLLAEARYTEAAEFFNAVTSQYAATRSSKAYDTNRNPFAFQFISDQWCRAKETHMEADEPYYKKWFANRMSSLQNTMENKALPANERAAAGVEYAVGMANSVYPCWSLTQYGVGESPFFPYQSTPKKNNRRATEIIHDFISDEYSLADRPRGFDMSHQRLQTLREKSEEILGVYIAMLEPNKAAAILERMGRYLTIKHKYQNTNIAQQLKSSCDRWSDW